MLDNIVFISGAQQSVSDIDLLPLSLPPTLPVPPLQEDLWVITEATVGLPVLSSSYPPAVPHTVGHLLVLLSQFIPPSPSRGKAPLHETFLTSLEFLQDKECPW